MQVHYNLLNGRTPDRSRAVLTVAPAAAKLTPLQTMLLPAPVEIPCAQGEQGRLCGRNEALFDLTGKYGSQAAFVPAGLLILCRGSAANPRAGAVSTCDRRLTQPTTIHVAAGHMHLLGASIRVELNPGTPRAQVLLDIPRWDFHWQNAYTLAREVEGRSRRRRARHLPARRAQADARRPRHPEDTALRALGRGHHGRDVPRHPPGDARVNPLRILLVSQMYPGPDDPDLGVFVANLERELALRGHDLERAVVDRRAGGKRRHFGLALDALRVARQFRPDVVYAHFLVPAGLLGALASRAPLVATAHGQDVENARTNPVIRLATRHVVRRASAIVAVSNWLRDRLAEAVPEAASKTEVVDCGVDLERFSPRDSVDARAEVGWVGDGTGFLCLGGLSERKNVLRLARAFEQRGEGTLTFVGDGPLRAALAGRPGIELAGRVGHDEVPAWIAASDVVCQPSLVEPFGLATLEAMASARSVVATRMGGPPEFVTPESGLLVDPEDEHALVSALAQAAALPRPNLAAREAAGDHDVKLQAARVEAILERAARGPRA